MGLALFMLPLVALGPRTFILLHDNLDSGSGVALPAGQAAPGAGQRPRRGGGPHYGWPAARRAALGPERDGARLYYAA
ncbi:MAG: hypothetical protein WKG07_19445 [Hymenobacter sp.]